MGLRFFFCSPLELLRLCRVEWAAARAALLIERNHHSDGAFYTGERSGGGSDEEREGEGRGAALSRFSIISRVFAVTRLKSKCQIPKLNTVILSLTHSRLWASSRDISSLLTSPGSLVDKLRNETAPRQGSHVARLSLPQLCLLIISETINLLPAVCQRTQPDQRGFKEKRGKKPHQN